MHKIVKPNVFLAEKIFYHKNSYEISHVLPNTGRATSLSLLAYGTIDRPLLRSNILAVGQTRAARTCTLDRSTH